jgi:PAS domain S-box-containing protein
MPGHHRRMITSLSPDVLAQMLDASPLRIFWKDRDSRFLGCNQSFADDADVVDPQEFVGRSDYYFYHPEQAAAFRDDDADVMYTGKPKLRIIEKITKIGGKVIWLETNKWPLRDSAGTIIGVVGMYHDITERVQAEQDRAETGADCVAAA